MEQNVQQQQQNLRPERMKYKCWLPETQNLEYLKFLQEMEETAYWIPQNRFMNFQLQ